MLAFRVGLARSYHRWRPVLCWNLLALAASLFIVRHNFGHRVLMWWLTWAVWTVVMVVIAAHFAEASADRDVRNDLQATTWVLRAHPQRVPFLALRR